MGASPRPPLVDGSPKNRSTFVAERQTDNVHLSPPYHQARCRALVTEMRGMYAQCQEMSQQESALKATAKDTEAWESKTRGEVVIGAEKGAGGDGSGSGSSGEAEWGEEEDDSEEARKRRNAGVSLFAFLRFDFLWCSDCYVGCNEEGCSLSRICTFAIVALVVVVALES